MLVDPIENLEERSKKKGKGKKKEHELELIWQSVEHVASFEEVVVGGAAELKAKTRMGRGRGRVR